MSDRIISADNSENNAGISLPFNTSATHNLSLSPLFFGHSGGAVYDRAIVSRALEVNIWTATVLSAGYSGRFVASAAVRPSYWLYRQSIFSLRRLVSTTNSYMIKYRIATPRLW